MVAQNVRLRGDDGEFSAIHVYFEFDKDGYRQGVAVICLARGQPLIGPDVVAFSSKIGTLSGLRLAMVTAAVHSVLAERAGAL